MGAMASAQVPLVDYLVLEPEPFVAALVDCDGTSVRGNVVNTEPDADHVSLGMKVQLTTFPIGADGEGTEAIAFGFEPIN
jgi:uncharacterized OB-fold protein